MENKTITVSKIVPFNKKETNEVIGYNIFEGVDENEIKYTVWKTKKDGNETKAYAQLKAAGVDVGSIIEIAYKLDEKPYIHKETGKQIIGKNRTIMFIPNYEKVITPEKPVEPTKESFDKDIEKFGEEVRNREFDTSKIPF